MYKSQSIDALSSIETDIIATDECLKHLNQITETLDDLLLRNKFISEPTTIYNNNSTCVT